MDKLRNIEYFAVAARANSFSAAARILNVSVVAVTKGVAALEQHLTVKLFERLPSGVRLTDEGRVYLEYCEPALTQLTVADDQIKSSARNLEGTVILGINTVVARHVIAPNLLAFQHRYPRIQLWLKDFAGIRVEEYEGIDVFITTDWNTYPDVIQRSLQQSVFWVVASSRYWSEHGIPNHPRDLLKHDCLLLSTNKGTVMDLWRFKRADEDVSVVASGPLIFSNGHRDTLIEAARSGQGVIRTLDWAVKDDVNSGRLVRVLSDWKGEEAPPTQMLYRPSARSTPRIWAVIDFFATCIETMNTEMKMPTMIDERPAWGARGYRRSSEHLKKRS
jgi:LysR family transcriptional regulator for bpeEF and oprC